MEIVTLKHSDLKFLKNSPVKCEDVPLSPLTIVNQNNEILFGMNPPNNEEVEVIRVNIEDSRHMALILHQVGLSCRFNCYEYLTTSKKNLGIPEDCMPIDDEMLDKWCTEFVNSRKSVNDNDLF